MLDCRGPRTTYQILSQHHRRVPYRCAAQTRVRVLRTHVNVTCVKNMVLIFFAVCRAELCAAVGLRSLKKFNLIQPKRVTQHFDFDHPAVGRVESVTLRYYISSGEPHQTDYGKLAFSMNLETSRYCMSTLRRRRAPDAIPRLTCPPSHPRERT